MNFSPRSWPWPRLAALAAVVLAGLLAFHWRPARQVRLHQKHLQTALENRNWPRFAAFLAPDYRDPWSPDRAALLASLPEAFRDFLAIGILTEGGTLERSGADRIWTARLKIVGSGGPVAQYIMDRASELREPFRFTWKRQSWKPWDWKLVGVSQPEIEMPETGGAL